MLGTQKERSLILISIIIPVYNKEKYIDSCLSNVCNQSYKNIEIIVINDGSEDNSENFIEKWAIKDSRVKYYSQQNQGVSKTRNRGISISKGDYIYFLDADDIIDKNCIGILVEKTIINEVDIIIGNFSFNKGNIQSKSPNIGNYMINPREGITTQNRADMFFTNGSPMASVCNKLYSHNFLRRANAKFEDGILAEDRLFNLKCFIKSPTISVVNEYTYTCNIIENSRSRSINSNYYKETISLFHNFYGYLKKEDKIEQQIDLIQFTLITDIEKILNYMYSNSNKRMIELRFVTTQLKKDSLVSSTIRYCNKQKTLSKIEGNKNNLKRIRIQNYMFLHSPVFVFSVFYIIYRKMVLLKQVVLKWKNK